MGKYDCDVAEDERRKNESIDALVARKVQEEIRENLTIDVDSTREYSSYGSNYKRIDVCLVYKGEVISRGYVTITEPE